MKTTKMFNGKRYYFYENFVGDSGIRGKTLAKAEANRVRRGGMFLVRVVKSPYGGYDLYTRPTNSK